jgi:hypothetical protein
MKYIGYKQSIKIELKKKTRRGTEMLEKQHCSVLFRDKSKLQHAS